MINFEFLNNYADAVCVFSENKEIIFKNKLFESAFFDFKSLERFKKRFNFNLCFLSSDKLKELTPIDILLNSDENFHTICTYQNHREEILYYYIYSINDSNGKVVVFKDITNDYSNRQYSELSVKDRQIQDARMQALKMGIINRISLVIRETNDMETVVSSALGEIHNLLASFKTYFSMREKNNFKIIYSVTDNSDVNTITSYEDDVIRKIKNKDIFMSSCLKEHLNSTEFLQKGVTRVIIPVYNKNKLLGIIVTFTKQKFNEEENRHILQSISVQLGGAVIQSGLITQLNKKNKKLEKTLQELKETQLQLINSEKMASLGQLISGVAHEINTPLASISSNNAMMSKILSNKTISKEQTQLLKELNSIDTEASLRISDIVKSLKRFVRLDEAEFQQANINKELDLTLKLIEHETRNKIKIEKKYSDIPLVYCSVNMLNQVFMNILINACHSIEESGEKGVITITTVSDEKNLYVKIKDNGAGIPISIQPKIFNVGFTTKKIGVGTGFGLSISKKIIEFHKGNISFTSKENSGTEFVVSIPVLN